MIIQNIHKEVKLSKNGKPFASVSIQLDEYKDGKGNRRWISGFGNKRTWLWKIGDDVNPTIEDAGKYLNFSFDDTDENKLDVYKLPASVGFVLELMKGRQTTEAPRQSYQSQAKVETTSDEIRPEDVPF